MIVLTIGRRFHCSAWITASVGLPVVLLGNPAPGNANSVTYTQQLVNQTIVGGHFLNLNLDPNTLKGPGAYLKNVSVNATLDSSFNYTFADDLTFFLNPPPFSFTAGRLQIGGYSDSLSITWLTWPNGDSDAVGTTVVGSFDETSWLAQGPIDLYDYFSTGNGIWYGNGLNGTFSSGSWTGVITVEYVPVYVPASLPMAGAIASLAWARKLRRRIAQYK